MRLIRWEAVRLLCGKAVRLIGRAGLLSVLLTGCASFWSSAPSTLPPPSALPCCWQAQERVQVSAQGEEHTFLAALAVDPDTLTVVVLDDLGRRLLTLIHDGGHLKVLDAPPGWPESLSQQLLLAVYLHHLTPEQWTRSTENWSVVEAGSRRTLLYRARERVTLHYAAVGATVAVAPFARPRRIEFVGQEVQINVVTLSRDALSKDASPDDSKDELRSQP